MSWPPEGLGTRTGHSGSSHHSPSAIKRYLCVPGGSFRVVVQTPSLPFSKAMAPCCQSVKSPTNKTLVASGAVKRKVCFFGCFLFLDTTSWPFPALGCLPLTETARPRDDNLRLRASSPFNVKPTSCSFQPGPVYPVPVYGQPETAESFAGPRSCNAAPGKNRACGILTDDKSLCRHLDDRR